MRLPTIRRAGSAWCRRWASSGCRHWTFGDAAKAKVGDPVVLADGIGRSVQASIVAKQEFAGYWEYLLDEAIFIAPAHPSWGGAALVGADGKLLGIGSLRLQMSRNGETADINMVVPINLLPPILDDLLTRGQVSKPPRPWLGAFSAESDGEVVVMSVAEGGPAAQAGLRPGDIISDIRDGRGRRSGRFLSQAVGERPCRARRCPCGSCATAAKHGCASNRPTATASSASRNCSRAARSPGRLRVSKRRTGGVQGTLCVGRRQCAACHQPPELVGSQMPGGAVVDHAAEAEDDDPVGQRPHRGRGRA